MQTTNLFAKTTTKTSAPKKADKKVLTAHQLGDKVKRYADLKNQIDALTGELKMIEGDIKLTGKELFLDQYKKEKRTPDNFKIQDETGSSCLFIVMDKYTSVDDDKAEILRNFDGLLGENVVYKFNTELVEKYGAILSDLITSSPDIEETDKGNLISGEKTYSIAKGSIDRLLQFSNPEQVLELINPICSLKK
jgi:lipopolysaccharide assembly outer membrane protein LptD (OstA)